MQNSRGRIYFGLSLFFISLIAAISIVVSHPIIAAVDSKDAKALFLWWSFLGVGVVALALVVLMVAVILVGKGPFSGALLSRLPHAIMVAVFFMMVNYLLRQKPDLGALGISLSTDGDAVKIYAVFMGAVAGLLWWPLSAAIYTLAGASSVVSANPRSYGMLEYRLKRLEARLEAIVPNEIIGTPSKQAAVAEARSHCASLQEELITNREGGGTKWVLGEGYIDMWNRLHRAEEALIEVEPAENLVGYALYDHMRLHDSNISNREELTKVLDYAASQIELPANKYLDACSTVSNKPGPAVASPAIASSNANSAPTTRNPDAPFEVTNQTVVPIQPQLKPQIEQHEGKAISDKNLASTQARVALAHVRKAINEFRDTRWAAIVQARNRLMSTVLFTMFATYGLIVFAILQGVPQEAIFAAVVFFLIGATTGLFNRQRIDAKLEADVDDYGLAHARLIHTPLFSGLAAVAGVVIFAIAPSLVNAQAVTPQAAPAGAGTSIVTIPRTDTLTLTSTTNITSTTRITNSTYISSSVPTTITLSPQPGQDGSIGVGAAAAPKTIPELKDVFSIDGNKFGLIVAATFGLVPSLLVGALQRQVERYKVDIESTEAQATSKPKTQ
jgi:hypothetical protein